MRDSRSRRTRLPAGWTPVLLLGLVCVAFVAAFFVAAPEYHATVPEDAAYVASASATHQPFRGLTVTVTFTDRIQSVSFVEIVLPSGESTYCYPSDRTCRSLTLHPERSGTIRFRFVDHEGAPVVETVRVRKT